MGIIKLRMKFILAIASVSALRLLSKTKCSGDNSYDCNGTCVASEADCTLAKTKCGDGYDCDGTCVASEADCSVAKTKCGDGYDCDGTCVASEADCTLAKAKCGGTTPHDCGGGEC